MIDIPWYVKWGIAIVVGFALNFGFKAYKTSVFNDGVKFAENRRADQDAAQVAIDTATARADEVAAQKLRDAEQRARNEKEKDRETYIATLETRVRTGAVSLRIATAAIRAGSSGGDRGPVAGPAEEKGTDLLPETSIAFIGIARDSARDVRDYNALMVEYERAQALCNKGSRPQ